VSAITKAQAEFLRRIRDKGSFQPYAAEWNTAYRLQAKGLISKDADWNVSLTLAGRAALSEVRS
jgi:hypothetical protein